MSASRQKQSFHNRSLCDTLHSRRHDRYGQGEDLPRRILMTNSTEIQLRKAPRIFFDQEKCAEYIAHFDAEEIALMHLSSPLGIDFSWWKDPMKPDEAARIRKEEIFKLKMDLIQGFYKRLENNSIIASGRSFNSPQRIPIPPERWRELWQHTSATGQ